VHLLNQNDLREFNGFSKNRVCH